MSSNASLYKNSRIIKKPVKEIALNKLKQKDTKKSESNTTRALEDKDIISNESFLKKYQMQGSEISYESYKEEKPILIDTLLENGVKLQNNYINFPRAHENNLLFSEIKSSILIKEDNDEDKEGEEKKYLSDIYEEDYEPNIRNTKIKLKQKKKISKLIDGEDFFEDKNKELKKGYYSDSNNEKDLIKNKKESKSNESSKNEFDPKFTENMLSNYKNTGNTKTKNKGNEINKNIIEPIKNSLTISKNMSNENINPISKTKTLKKIKHSTNFNDDDEEEIGKGKINNINTEYEHNEKKDIRKKMKYLRDGENRISSQDESDSSLNKNNKSYFSKDSKEGLNLKNSIKNLSSGKKDKNNSKSTSKNNNENIIEFEEEEENNADMAIPIDENNLKKNNKKTKKKHSIKNNKNIDIIDSNDDANIIQKKEEKIEKKSDFEIFKEKVLSSSMASFVQNQPLDQEGKTNNEFFKFYWHYLKKREIFIVCFFDEKESIPYFVRWSCFIFCLFFIFMLNCFFFLQSSVHKRFIHAKNGGINDITYYLKNELIYCIYCSLINILFKIIIIKLVLNRGLRIKEEDKKMMDHSYENEITEDELDQLKNKRIKFLVKYHIKLIVYFIIMFLLSVLFAYICICYSEVFKNSITGILYGFFFSIIFSFVFCAALCFIIVCFYKTGKTFKNKCLFSTFIVLSTMY